MFRVLNKNKYEKNHFLFLKHEHCSYICPVDKVEQYKDTYLYGMKTIFF